MLQKKAFILLVITVSFLVSSCDSSFPGQVCTAEFRSAGVAVYTMEKEPVVLDEFVITSKQFHSEGELEICGNGFDCENGKLPGWPERGIYVIFHDGLRSTVKGGVMPITASGKNEEIEFEEEFIISSDGCHISKEAGPDTIFVDTQ